MGRFFALHSAGLLALICQVALVQGLACPYSSASAQNPHDSHIESRSLLGKVGGGLVNGVLQPLTGALQGIDVPTPQLPGLAKVPDAAHPYQPPPPGAVRGMCPTMNTLANHGYVNRSGITTFAEAANACQTAYGFGYDTCVFLSATGLTAGGDLTTGKMSIGGADSRVPNTIGPALGLSHHGPFEGDQSITRQDKYFGNQADFQLSRWNRLNSFAKAHGGIFGQDAFAAEHMAAYNESRSTNPEFDALLPIGFVIALAERVFTYRALANGTADGKADYASVAPFFLNETFPSNWYRRSTAYTIPDVLVDVNSLHLAGPTEPGQNQGLGNFVSYGNVSDISNPSRLACLLRATVLDTTPGQTSGQVDAAIDKFQAFVDAVVNPFFKTYNCDLSDYTDPGVSAGDKDPGVSTTKNRIVNGVYQ